MQSILQDLGEEGLSPALPYYHLRTKFCFYEKIGIESIMCTVRVVGRTTNIVA